MKGAYEQVIKYCATYHRKRQTLTADPEAERSIPTREDPDGLCRLQCSCFGFWS